MKKSTELRKKAEKKLEADTIDIKKLSEEELLELAHELQVHQIELEMQNDELRKAQLKLAQSHAKYVGLYDYAPVGYVTFDEKGKILQANLTIAEWLAVDRKYLINKSFCDYVNMKDKDIFYLHLKEIFESKYKIRNACELRLKGVNDIEFWALLDSLWVQDSGVSSCRTSVTDITERKKAAEETRAFLKEKEVLLKEIHHRVKNNMQVVSSIISLQSKKINEKMQVDFLVECRDRIKAMAIVHEELYHTKDLANVDFAGYVRALTDHLMMSYRGESDSISVDINIDNIFFGIDKAVPCGLIINELITNTLKYAFPEDKKGKLKISMQRIADFGLRNAELKSEIPNSKFEIRNSKFEIELVFSDNGIGLPKDTDFKNPNTLGLELVNILTQQLEGTIELDRSKGTEFRIVFEV